jgi:hypothetical protein
MQVPLHLRGDGQDIGGHQKNGELLGDCWRKKVGYLPQYDSFMGMRGEIGGLLEMLLVRGGLVCA